MSDSIICVSKSVRTHMEAERSFAPRVDPKAPKKAPKGPTWEDLGTFEGYSLKRLLVNGVHQKGVYVFKGSRQVQRCKGWMTAWRFIEGNKPRR